MLGSIIDEVTSGRVGDPLVGSGLPKNRKYRRWKVRSLLRASNIRPLYGAGGFYDVVPSTLRASYRPFEVAERCCYFSIPTSDLTDFGNHSDMSLNDLII